MSWVGWLNGQDKKFVEDYGGNMCWKVVSWRWKYTIKIDLKKIGFEDRRWMELARDQVLQWTLVGSISSVEPSGSTTRELFIIVYYYCFYYYCYFIILVERIRTRILHQNLIRNSFVARKLLLLFFRAAVLAPNSLHFWHLVATFVLTIPLQPTIHV